MTEDYSYEHPRSAWAITLSVWKALFLRESISRLSNRRMAWMWLLLDPMVQIAFMLTMMTVINVTVIGGIDTMSWLIVGITGYQMFQKTGSQSKNAISSNQSLFAYRQVKVIDTVIVRTILEGFIEIIITVILCAGTLFVSSEIIPDDPLLVFAAFFALWLMGVGFGLIMSVVAQLLPEIAKIIDYVMMPLYILSGVIMPMSSIDPSYRHWLLLNPLIHGVESCRVGMSNFYHTVPGVDLVYLYKFALCAVFLGLALHRRFALKLITK